MIYLLDANVLIDANRDYYSFDRVPEFWEWLVFMGKENNAKVPIEVYEEVKGGKDDLAIWLKKKETEAALLLLEEVDITIIPRIISEGYANDLTDT